MIQKAWWKSKTLWLNALVLLFATLEAKLDLLREVAPTTVYAAIAIALPVLNMLLRFITSTALARKDSEYIP